ncbi:MAG TPA: hypothetical protein VHS78_05510 [Candidatus Elarobacter sp.]|jgi:hypothetical protein|nr:hypothetical protein [Candidatus Elarobacter sp.]
MSAHGALWRTVSPLREGATAGWMRSYYEHLYELAFRARTAEDVAKIVIRHAHATFRSELVAVVLRHGDEWNVLPYRQNDAIAPPLRIPAGGDEGPAYEPGQIVEIPDIAAFTQRFPWMAPLAERRVGSLVLAAFGSMIHERGYLAFASYRDQHYSDDEYVLMCLHALAAGIGFDHVGANFG